MVRIVVRGKPAPQGSKKAFLNKRTGRINQVEDSARSRPWRAQVQQAAEDVLADMGATAERFTGPVFVSVAFYFDRPNTHYRSGRNSHLLRDNAPAFPHNKGTYDLDKLQRTIFDALTSAGVWADDSQVASVVATKRWTDDGASDGLTVPGVVIDVAA